MSDVISAETDPPEVTEHTNKKPPKQFTVDPNGLEVFVLNNPRGFSAQVHSIPSRLLVLFNFNFCTCSFGFFFEGSSIPPHSSIYFYFLFKID